MRPESALISGSALVQRATRPSKTFTSALASDPLEPVSIVHFL
jgi:hypothetical protein